MNDENNINENDIEFATETNPLYEMQKKIDILYQKYNEFPEMQQKMHIHICNNLELLLEKQKKIIEQKNVKKQFLQMLQNECYSDFVCDGCPYYYFGSTPIVFDGCCFMVGDSFSEANTIYSKINFFLSSKEIYKKNFKKLRKHLLKQIQKRQIIHCKFDIDEFNLTAIVPTLFKNNQSAIYFLTIIGDILKGKNTSVFYIHPNAKPLIEKWNEICQQYFAKSILSCFRTKYIDVEFELCRCLTGFQLQNTETIQFSVADIIHFLCISCVLSDKYENADNYLQNYTEEQFITKNIFYFKDHKNTKNIVIDFLRNEVEYVANKNVKPIDNKTLYYSFCLYLETKNIPNIFSATFIQNFFENTILELFPDLTITKDINGTISYFNIICKKLPIDE
jgi:hypothetical protein